MPKFDKYLVPIMILIMFAVIGLCCLIGVSLNYIQQNEPSEVSTVSNERFSSIETVIKTPNVNNSYILVDNETGVEYLYLFKGEGCTITVLYNEDGTPKINEEHKLNN